MKKFSVYAVCGVATLFAVFSLYSIKVKHEPESAETVLQKSFKSCGAKAISSNIYFWGKLPEECDSFDKMQGLASAFLSELGVSARSTCVQKAVNNDFVQKIEMNGTTEDNRIISISVQSNGQNSYTTERTIYINVSQDIAYSGLEKIRGDVLFIFEKHHIKPKVNSCITGYYSGFLSLSQLNEACRNALNGVGAVEVEGINERNMISVAAYSPYIKDYIRVNGKKVNINVALRYNSYEDKTYIWLATPVITTEY